MKKNLAPILVIAFAMAIVCTAIFYGLVAGKLGEGAQANGTAKILVDTRPIARGAIVSVLDVKTAPWNDALPDGALGLPADAEGLTALSDIAIGEPMLSSRLMNKQSGGGLGIPSGMRAISVQVHDSSGVVALLKSGHRVDVQAVYSRSGANQDAEIRTVLENIEILKINPVPEPAPGRPTLPVATLLVTPLDADAVGLADAVARVRLVLRNPLDSEKLSRNTIAVAGLMRGMAASSPAPPTRVMTPAVISVPRAPGPGLSLAPVADTPACNPPKAEGAVSSK